MEYSEIESSIRKYIALSVFPKYMEAKKILDEGEMVFLMTELDVYLDELFYSFGFKIEECEDNMIEAMDKEINIKEKINDINE